MSTRAAVREAAATSMEHRISPRSRAPAPGVRVEATVIEEEEEEEEESEGEEEEEGGTVEEYQELLNHQIRAIMMQHAEDMKRMPPAE